MNQPEAQQIDQTLISELTRQCQQVQEQQVLNRLKPLHLQISVAATQSQLEAAQTQFQSLSVEALKFQNQLLSQLRPIFEPERPKVELLKNHLKSLVEGQHNESKVANQEKFPDLFEQYRSVERDTEDLSHIMKRAEQLVKSRVKLFLSAKTIQSMEQLFTFIQAFQTELLEMVGTYDVLTQVNGHVQHAYLTGEAEWNSLPTFLQPIMRMLLENQIAAQKIEMENLLNHILEFPELSVEQLTAGLHQLTWYHPGKSTYNCDQLAQMLANFWPALVFQTIDEQQLEKLIPEPLQIAPLKDKIVAMLAKHPSFIVFKLETMAKSGAEIDELISRLKGISTLYTWLSPDGRSMSAECFANLLAYILDYLVQHPLVPKYKVLFWQFGYKKRSKKQLRALIPTVVQKVLRNPELSYDLLPTILSALQKYQMQLPIVPSNAKKELSIKKYKGINFLLLGKQIVIGKSDAEIHPDINLKSVLGETSISNQQCVLNQTEHGYQLTDYGSDFGTYLTRRNSSNNQPRMLNIGSPMVLKAGDILQFGRSFQMQYRIGNGKRYLMEVKEKAD